MRPSVGSPVVARRARSPVGIEDDKSNEAWRPCPARGGAARGAVLRGDSALCAVERGPRTTRRASGWRHRRHDRRHGRTAVCDAARECAGDATSWRVRSVWRCVIAPGCRGLRPCHPGAPREGSAPGARRPRRGTFPPGFSRELAGPGIPPTPPQPSRAADERWYLHRAPRSTCVPGRWGCTERRRGLDGNSRVARVDYGVAGSNSDDAQPMRS